MQFIRCILPNKDKESGNFDQEFVLSQLNTSCTVAYAKFIRFGYAKRVSFEELIDKCKPIEDKFSGRYFDRSSFYSKVLLSIGFRLDEFKMGNAAIFFRSNKFELIQQFFQQMEEGPFKENRNEQK